MTTTTNTNTSQPTQTSKPSKPSNRRKLQPRSSVRAGTAAITCRCCGC